MKIYTTYFARVSKLPENVVPIAICGGIPKWWTGLTFKELAPKKWFFDIWKENGDNDFYIDKYNSCVLNIYQAADIVEQLWQLSRGKDVALVCYEKDGKFCHRHLVAKWLRKNGYECEEWKP